MDTPICGKCKQFSAYTEKEDGKHPENCSVYLCNQNKCPIDIQTEKCSDRHLYRGKDVHTQKWVVGHLAIWLKGYASIVHYQVNSSGVPVAEDRHEVDPKTIGQCLGEKDHNGVLLFEGDVVRQSPTGKVYPIVWNKTGFFRQGGKNFFVIIPHECYIAGNVHEPFAVKDPNGRYLKKN